MPWTLTPTSGSSGLTYTLIAGEWMVGRNMSLGIDVACGNAKVRVPEHGRPSLRLPPYQLVRPANTSSIASTRIARLR